MPTPSHAAHGAAAPWRPDPADLLRDDAQHVLTEISEDATEISGRLIGLITGHEWHELGADQWISPPHRQEAERIAAAAALVAADARALLAEVVPE